MVNVEKVTKKYGNFGNNEITFEIKKGEVYGILGPNGAGKTTLIRQILGLIKSDSGTILIDGLNPWNNSKKIMDTVGYLPGEINLYEDLTGKQYLNIFISLKEITNKNFIENLINHFDLNLNIKIKKMSKGTKQKLMLIAAVANEPKVLILDEPTSGLDPVMQNQFNRLINSLKEKGTTILMCSHMFEEVAKLCDKVGFINNGELVKEYVIKQNDIESLEKEFKSIYERKDYL